MLKTFCGCEISEQLHAGTATHVYRGRRRADGLPVVLKVLEPSAASPHNVSALQHEHALLQSLEVPGIIKAHGLEQDGGRHALLLEDVGGQSLEARRLRMGRLPLPEWLELALTLTDILDGMHRQGVVHKDLNPSNVVVGASGEVRLIDFGIATRLQEEEPAFASPRVLEGTLAYLSPEQTGRMNRRLDYRTDYYSLGCTLYALLVGHPPFFEGEPLEIVHSHVARLPPSPRSVDPSVSEGVAELVLKLLAKNADDRYQSARGLRADLRHCQEQLRRGQPVSLFPLGRDDRSEHFLLPRKLYGREAQVQRLMGAFERASRGATELVLVSGYSGIGKSSVIHELHQPLTQRRGMFLAGKFDQYQRTPYAALLQALTSMADLLLAESEEQLGVWRQRLLGALGTHGQVLVEACPRLGLVLGPQPPVAALAPADARSRFHRVVVELFAALAVPEHPLCVFFDDLQWADAESLQLLQELLLSARELPLLLLGAYRDNEVDAAHPVTALRKQLEAQGARVEQVVLEPLAPRDVQALVADTLTVPMEAAEPLARLLMERTGGNPFFVRAFLSELHARGLLKVTADGWRWDLERIRHEGVTDNVVELLVQRMQRLPPASRDILTRAACVGSPFDLETLVRVTQRPQAELAGDLWEPLAQGLVLPLGPVHSPVELAAQDTGFRCRFAHDRVQQAALALVAPEARSALHRDVGLRLLKHTRPEEQERWLFDITGQLNQARALLEPGEPLRELASLNLKAARKALRAAAGQRALEYARAGLDTLGDASWTEQYEPARDLHVATAEAALLCGEFDQLHTLCGTLREQARDVLDALPGFTLAGQAHFAQQRVVDGLRMCIDALARLGLDVPLEPTPEQVEAARKETLDALAGRHAESLQDLPACEDPKAKAALQLLSQLALTSWTAATSLFPVAVYRLVRHTVQHGSTPDSAFGFMAYGVLTLKDDDIDRAYGFGRLALRVAERSGNRSLLSLIYLYAYCHLIHWKTPLPELAHSFEDAYRYGLEAGSPFNAAGSLETLGIVRFYGGEELGRLGESLEQSAGTISRLRQTLVLGWHQIFQQTVHNLRAEEDDPKRMAGPFFDESQRLKAQQAAGDVGTVCNYYFCKAFLCYLFDDAAQAVACFDANAPLFAAMAKTAFYAAPWTMLGALSRLALYEGASAEEQQRILEQVDAQLRQLAHWEGHCPRGFEHKRWLVEAERARVLGQWENAATAFARAVELARRSGYVHEEAMAHELAARFHLGRGEWKRARQLLREAHHAYLRWGAFAKARALERQHPSLLPRVAGSSLRASTLMAVRHDSNDFNVLDLVSMVEASQALSREIELDRLLVRLMELLIETSGAEAGYLLLEQNGRWRVEAERVVGQDEAPVRRALPLEEMEAKGGRGLPISLLHYVARTQQTVVLDDASQSLQFGRDAYLSRHRVRSVLCFSLALQGGRRGVVYLENRLVEGAFPPGRIRILQMLSTQAVISLENALLYETLEHKVEARTRELQARNSELGSALQRLQETQERMIVQDRLASLGSLAAGIAHELRNPLNFVNNFANVANSLVQELGEEMQTVGQRLDTVEDVMKDLRQSVSRIGEHGKRMESIIRSMLDHSRGGTSERQEVDFNSLVQTYVGLGYHGVRSRMPNLDVAIELDLAGDLRPQWLVPQEISRVIINMLDNACYAVHRKREAQGAGFAPRIQVKTRNLGHAVELRIHDNGTGIPPAARDKVFQPFFTTKAAGEGTGLGLSISYNIIVQGNGGSLHFESQEGEFTEFIITLPSRQRPAPAEDPAEG
jgi:histidine kinase